MILKCGIVGLPNVGKSTLFNSLIASNLAETANYPFCTIQPNHGITSVPDERLVKLAHNAKSKKVIPAFIEFVDIAGLVKNASKGEGLGNKFLSHIREVDAIIHVLRCFEKQEIIHVHNNIDPIYDAEIVETELILSDLELVDKKIATYEKKLKSFIKDKEHFQIIQLLKDCKNVLEAGKPVRTLKGKDDLKNLLSSLQLITAKPVLYVCNVLESEEISGNRLSLQVAQKAKKEKANSITLASRTEAEIFTQNTKIKQEVFDDKTPLKETVLAGLIQGSYSLLDLKSFFTVCPKEAHAWTFKSGTSALQAAGIIHSDFLRGFIRAEIINYADLLSIGSRVKAKDLGKIRVEGKQYLMQDGDVVYFRTSS